MKSYSCDIDHHIDYEPKEVVYKDKQEYGHQIHKSLHPGVQNMSELA